MTTTTLTPTEITELEIARDLNEDIFTFYTRVRPLLPRLLAEYKANKARWDEIHRLLVLAVSATYRDGVDCGPVIDALEYTQKMTGKPVGGFWSLPPSFGNPGQQEDAS